MVNSTEDTPPQVEGCGANCGHRYWYWGYEKYPWGDKKRKWWSHNYGNTTCGEKNSFGVSYLCDNCARPLGLVW